MTLAPAAPGRCPHPAPSAARKPAPGALRRQEARARALLALAVIAWVVVVLTTVAGMWLIRAVALGALGV